MKKGKIIIAAIPYIMVYSVLPPMGFIRMGEELVPSLEHHGYLKIDDDTRSQLISISPATIDRILKPIRSTQKGISTTKPGSDSSAVSRV